MPEITVWTKQNEAVIDHLEAAGRFIADECYIHRELGDISYIMLFIYRWLADHMPASAARPDDVKFPVWVSFTKEATMSPESGYAVLELMMQDSMVTHIDATKWTRITNYSYIPISEEDETEHRNYMRELGTDDARAVMTQFWPEARKKIIDSWDRLFDKSVVLDGTTEYGLLWEVRKEWVQKISV